MAVKSKAEKGPPTLDSPEYIEFCERQAKRVRVELVESGRMATACLVHTWKRDDAEIRSGPIMSASSGPKDYLQNDVIALFADAEVFSVTLLVLNSVPFLLINRGGLYTDVKGNRVRASLVEG